MENKRGFIMRNGICIGQDVQRVFSTCPLGTVLSFAGQTAPRGFLLCDGASYPTADYPDLYAVIGNTYGGDSTNFNVPDYRETVLVGVGQNTTDTIASHDVYGLGEFKDDQMQSHTHSITIPNMFYGSWNVSSSGSAGYSSGTKTQTSTAAGVGATTHGKQKGVTYIIKAFHTNEGMDSGVSDDVVEYVEGEIATKLDKEYITGITDANNAIGENGVNIFVMSASSANMPLSRTGIIRSYTTIENKYIRVNQEYSTIDNSPQNGGTYKRYGASDDGGATYTWSNWNFVGSIDDSTTALLKTWSSSKIASEISSKADRQNNVKNTDYLKSDRPYLKISRNGSLSHVSYYTCETYILCSHDGNMGALSFICNDDGASCVYKNIVGTLPLSVEKYDEYTCWLKYSSTASEIYTVYALNGYKPTVLAVTSTT